MPITNKQLQKCNCPNNAMRILAIDTATESCSVVILNDGNTFAQFELCPREHAQRILPMIQNILKKSGLILTELNVLAFSRGPGSFTGVRIGIGIVQGLALGADLPIVSVSTLMIMAQSAWRKKAATRVLVAIDARMGEVYWAEYVRNAQGVWEGERTEALLKLEVITKRLQQLTGEWAIAGTAWKTWPDIAQCTTVTLTDGEVLLPAAEDMLPIVLNLLREGKILSVEHAEPVYLRDEIAWKKLIDRK